MSHLFLPRAKYHDSVIIREDNILHEIIINEVRGHFNDDTLFWVYYRTGKEGDSNVLYDVDILMNLTTGTIYEEVLDNTDMIPINQ